VGDRLSADREGENGVAAIGVKGGPFGDKPAGDRPAGDRPAGDGPAGDGPAGDGPAGDRPAGERLQKVLAGAGLGSRRACEQLIEEGRVTVNGTVAHLGQRADSSSDRIALDGIPMPVREGIVYYLLNKPAGVVTSAFDPEGRPTVIELVPEVPRVFPVGRLDIMSEGLLVLTNDGELAYQLTHPSFGVVKEYVVEVEGQLSREAIGRLRRGVELDDGPTARARVTALGPHAARIAVHEGRNRQVRRMCEAVGHPVVRLVRTRIGPVSDRTLAPGTWRTLTTSEVRSLWEATKAPKPAGPPVTTGDRRPSPRA
jgi:23S rRNA pseudouridine2605 synthase